MADTIIPREGIGVASSSTQSFTQFTAWVSYNPVPKTQNFPLAASQDIKAYMPVKLDSTGNVIKATYDAGNSFQAIGFACYALKTEAGDTDKKIDVYIAGAPNIDVLEWDSSFSDDAKKLGAFRGAPTPTNIVPGTNPFNRKT